MPARRSERILSRRKRLTLSRQARDEGQCALDAPPYNAAGFGFERPVVPLDAVRERRSSVGPG